MTASACNVEHNRSPLGRLSFLLPGCICVATATSTSIDMLVTDAAHVLLLPSLEVTVDIRTAVQASSCAARETRRLPRELRIMHAIFNGFVIDCNNL
jgi:hypothetical protein